MILHGSVAENAWAHYADQVRRDPTNVYFCSRLMEQAHRFGGMPDRVALLRTASLTVYKADPFAYVTTMPGLMRDFTDEDLGEIADGLDRIGDQDTTNFLRGKLWSDALRGRKDAAPVARRALDYLNQVSQATIDREPDYWPAVAECCRVTDYARYVQILPKVMESREPEWRAHTLSSGFREAIAHQDWATYAAWRELWDALPQNAHLCECNVNEVFVYDGLAELHRGNLEPIPGLLRKALDVRGCPHLNSYGPSLALVKALIDRGVLLDEAGAYLESAATRFGKHDRLEHARQKLEVARGK